MELTFAWIAVVLMVITSAGLLLVRDWRWSIILLAAQYTGMFILTLQHWPIGMASVKLVAGWMSAAILGMTRSGLPGEALAEENIWPRGLLFRLFLVCLGAIGWLSSLILSQSLDFNVEILVKGVSFDTGNGR